MIRDCRRRGVVCDGPNSLGGSLLGCCVNGGGRTGSSGDSAFIRSVRRGVLEIRNWLSGRVCWKES